jgi:hypothetical protein
MLVQFVLPMPKTLLAIVLALSWPAADKPVPEFISLEVAQPVLQAFDSKSSSYPSPTATREQWLAWLKTSDAHVRQRLEIGEEDSLTNLLRFGVTYTKEYRIDDEYLLQYGHSTLVNSFAENRANDLVRALSSPNRNQGFAEMRAFVEKKGFSLASPTGRRELKAFLLANLARMQRDLQQARAEAKTNRDQLFHDRGISLDSNLWPDYDIDLALQQALAKGLLTRESVKRVAIVGPGLDFVNKQEGVDYYPPQSTQPFAVLNSLLRLGVADPPDLEIYTLDISPRVNLHLQAALKNASAGRPYTMQLPWYAEGRWTDDFRTRFTEYWQNLGSQVGQPVAAIPVPAAAAGFTTRAVQVRAGMVQRIRPIDMNIVYQRLPLAPEQRFDLIIGTNIFLYYGALEQSLVRANVAAMLKPAGLLLSTDKLQNTVPAGLEEAFVSAVPMTTPPVITDYIYGYRLMTSEASKQRAK